MNGVFGVGCDVVGVGLLHLGIVALELDSSFGSYFFGVECCGRIPKLLVEWLVW